MATPGTENVDERVVAGVGAMTATGVDEELLEASSLKQDIEEGEISDDASPSTSASTPVPAPAPTPSLTPSNGSQPTQLRRPPSPSPAPPAPPAPPRDPEPELELVIEPVDDIEAELAEHKRRRNEILAKYSSHQGTPHLQTPSIPTEPPSTKASTPVGDGDGDVAATAEDFELSKAEFPKLNADGFGAADYDESADRREDAERALLHLTQDAMDVDEDEFEEEEVADEEDVDDMFAFDDDEKPKKKVMKKVKKAKPVNMLPDGGAGLDAADDLEGYNTPTFGETLDEKYHVFSVIGKGMFADGTLLPNEAPKREVAIKIMRFQEMMYKSGQREAALLAKLNVADPDDKRHVIRLERTFE
ncbi:hypothetical protein DL96DRAFT_1805388 [Flagelloscypha sp. PMI_526]|nr:hypothetical protein DL96DRAFT_1805388 [Flagelloscypha sp. PMI_526]